MKRIPKHINTYCTYCKALGQDKVVALWRSCHRSCEAHKEELAAYEKERSRSVVFGWGIATVPLTCISCLGTGYACVPVAQVKKTKDDV